ncbi:hypothetical protein HDE_14373 [Halotydeus destructor]|nr:hypothetical protein HDE_14373 [Halotydeus destructor]
MAHFVSSGNQGGVLPGDRKPDLSGQVLSQLPNVHWLAARMQPNQLVIGQSQGPRSSGHLVKLATQGGDEPFILVQLVTQVVHLVGAHFESRGGVNIIDWHAEGHTFHRGLTMGHSYEK